jgi:CHAD domain-containing protein
MHSLTPLPSLLVDEGGRRLALARLDEARAARSRMGSPDPEALHDYRVALRRLRSCLRSYRRALRSTLSLRSLRRLRRLAHGTNRSRDLEVHLAWLSQQRERCGEDERPGVGWLFERLTAAQREAEQAMRDLDEGTFPGLHDRLVDELTEFHTTIRLDGSLPSRSMAAATGSLVREASEQLKARLLKIHGYASEIPIHRARIGGKHLRYLIEPFAQSVPQGEAIVDRLKLLQNGFGDVHDAHVFLAELRALLPVADKVSSDSSNYLPGMETLMDMLEARGRQAFEEVARDWLHGAAEPFFQEVEDVATAISQLAQGQGSEDGDLTAVAPRPPLVARLPLAGARPRRAFT